MRSIFVFTLSVFWFSASLGAESLLIVSFSDYFHVGRPETQFIDQPALRKKIISTTKFKTVDFLVQNFSVESESQKLSSVPRQLNKKYSQVIFLLASSDYFVKNYLNNLSELEKKCLLRVAINSLTNNIVSLYEPMLQELKVLQDHLNTIGTQTSFALINFFDFVEFSRIKKNICIIPSLISKNTTQLDQVLNHFSQKGIRIVYSPLLHRHVRVYEASRTIEMKNLTSEFLYNALLPELL